MSPMPDPLLTSHRPVPAGQGPRGRRRPHAALAALRACGVLAFCVLTGDAWAQAVSVCEVRSLKGAAQWQHGARQGSVQAGLAVPVGMELRTAKAARLRLQCGDGSVLVMAEQSRLLVEHFEVPAGQPRMASFLLKLGLLGQKVAPVTGGHWQVRTPSAVTAVRGTEFLVEVDARQTTQVHVLSGEVAVESREPPESGAASEPFSSKGVQAQWRGEVGPGIVLQPGAGGVRCPQGRACSQSRRDDAAMQRLQQRLVLD